MCVASKKFEMDNLFEIDKNFNHFTLSGDYSWFFKDIPRGIAILIKNIMIHKVYSKKYYNKQIILIQIIF